MFADLHMHTTFSDGTFSPEEMAQAAQRHRLACVALTDHDTVVVARAWRQNALGWASIS